MAWTREPGAGSHSYSDQDHELKTVGETKAEQLHCQVIP